MRSKVLPQATQKFTATAPSVRRGLTLQKWSEIYGPSVATGYRLINAGKLHTVLIAGRRIVLVDSAEALLRGPDTP